ncbi:MAG: hypothetical protein ACJATC_001185 [Neptuniibacter pectenicola]|jgi:hypothetical protein|tara:strand:- start:609 stop:839 length:231 start_codon:yes stop_codon:yes gene_type:complete
MLAGMVIQAIAIKLMMIQAKPEESRKFSLCSAMVVTPYLRHNGANLFSEVNDLLLQPYSPEPLRFLLAGYRERLEP